MRRDQEIGVGGVAPKVGGELPSSLGRYWVYQEIASGGIGRVCLARPAQPSAVTRVLAVKTLHPHLVSNAGLVTMFLDEARLAARVRHPNVVSVLDVVPESKSGPFLVMEYIAGASLARLLGDRSVRAPLDVAIAIMSDVLEALHAAHHATNERGVPLNLVHRDVSPQNILVGVDGVTRVVDFGIAKAVGRMQETTEEGRIKGKLTYMPPEQLKGKEVDARSDLWAASVVLWELLTGRALFTDTAAAMEYHAGHTTLPRPTELPDSRSNEALDDVVMRGLARDMDERWRSAREMLIALDRAMSPAPARRVAQWVNKNAKNLLRDQAQWVKRIESDAVTPRTPTTSTQPAERVEQPDDLIADDRPVRPRMTVGRYELYEEIAIGGMATVHFGRLLGPVGFSRTVAIKRLHDEYAKDPAFAESFVDEARLSGRIVHPNVVQTLDVVIEDGAIYLVMEYVKGVSMTAIIRRLREDQARLPLDLVSAIVCGVLHGLHAAHEARAESGAPLEIVHRDVSPQNILLSVEGLARVIDFGVAKASVRLVKTEHGQIKGKLAYMAPEQIRGAPVDRRADIFGVGVVLWELLTGESLFGRETQGETLGAHAAYDVPLPSSIVADVPPEIDAICARALAKEPSERFVTAAEMASALEAAAPVASGARVAEWIDKLARPELRKLADHVRQIERSPGLERGEGEARPHTEPEEHAIGRRRLGWPLVAAVALVLSALGGGLVILRRPRAPAPPSEAAMTAEPGVTSAPPAPPPPIPSASIVTTEPAPPHRPKAPLSRPTPSKPCAVRTFIDSAGITHFTKDCK